MLAVLGGYNDASDGARAFADELLGLGVEAGVNTKLKAVLEDEPYETVVDVLAVVGLLLAGLVNEVDAGHVLLQAGARLGKDGLVDGGDDVGNAPLVHHVDVVVDAFAAVLQPDVEQVHVGLVAGELGVVVADLCRIDHDAFGLVGLGVHGADVVAACGNGVGLFNQDDLCASFGGGLGGNNASDASANNHDVEVFDGGDVGDGIGDDLPSMLGFRNGGGCLVGPIAATNQCAGGCQQASRCAALDKSAPREFVTHGFLHSKDTVVRVADSDDA